MDLGRYRPKSDRFSIRAGIAVDSWQLQQIPGKRAIRDLRPVDPTAKNLGIPKETPKLFNV